MTHDYSEDIDVSDDALGQLSELAVDLRKAQSAVVNLELELKIAKADVRELEETQIPELMDEVGMTEFATSGGLKIVVEKKVFASIPKYRMSEAIAWLDKNNEGGMVKRNVVVAFNRDQEDEATELADVLGKDYPAGVDQTYSVHASTLRAWARKRIEAGKPTPEELFGIHTKQVAKIG